jgi:hypothetical protein
MDRRRFLGLLGATGLVAVSRKFWDLSAGGVYLPDTDVWDEGDDELLDNSDLFIYNPPTFGPNRTFDISAFNNSRSEIARVYLTRPDGSVLLDLSHGPGGTVRWVAYPGCEIVGPIRIVSPAHVYMHVLGTNPAGQLVSAAKTGSDVAVVPMAFRRAFA